MVGRLKRKNLVVDAEKVEELARRGETSGLTADQEAVKFAIAADRVMAAIRKLHESGGIDDVFGHLADEAES